jgi:LuxR family transcriptional regulator of csgAB operon
MGMIFLRKGAPMEICCETTFSGKAISIWGKSLLKNQLLSYYLQEKTGNQCLISDSLSEIRQVTSGVAKASNLLLWDVGTIYADEIATRLNTENLLDEFTTALLDLRVDSHIEPTVLHLGVMGFFYQHDSPSHILRGVKHICEGNTLVSSKTIYQCFFGASSVKPSNVTTCNVLTKREEDVLRLVTHGYRNSEIADKLSISPHTVKAHLYQAFKKIKVGSRMLAAQWASSNLQSNA